VGTKVTLEVTLPGVWRRPEGATAPRDVIELVAQAGQAVNYGSARTGTRETDLWNVQFTINGLDKIEVGHSLVTELLRRGYEAKLRFLHR